MNRQIINEPMKVELGIWPIFLFLFGAPAVAATATTAAVAATTGFLTYAAIAGGALMTANSIIQSFNRPGGNSVSIPGMAAIQGLSPSISRELQRQQTELERLNQEELQRVEEQKKSEEQKALQQKSQNILVKYGPFIAVGGVVLVAVLLSRRKKWLKPKKN